MMSRRARIAAWISRIWENMLLADNHIIGFVICLFAMHQWLSVYDGIDAYRPYLLQGIYALPSLSTLNTLFSAIYLTGAAIILLSLRQPLSRYRNAWPNLLALTAAFGVYAFVLVPSGELFKTSAVAALTLIVCGSVLVIASLVFLRQAFTVTPQARFLVTSGPYAIVRHPMYVGNILSILGLTLLIDSKEAVVLFFICAALQIGRALTEERLLAATFPQQYAEYKARVGGFIPRLRLWPVASPALCLCALLVPQASPAGPLTPAVDIADPGKQEILQIAVRLDAKKCTEWSRKAKAGNLFPPKEQAEMFEGSAEADKIAAIPACKAFYDLRDSCETLTGQRLGDELNDAAFMEKIEETQGCMSLGAAEVCKALKALATTGQRLADNRLNFMANCIQIEIADKRFQQIRPAM
jgi:protein-S-isoprenylcysteine O-methyltransferase Ste14